MLASIGWAFLASLSRSDWIRANILLASFQREWSTYGGYVIDGADGMSPTIAAQLRSLSQGGRWDTTTAVALSIALKRSISVSQWPSGQADRQALVDTTSPGATGMAGAGTIFRERLLELAPFGDEVIWLAYNWAQQVAPQDAGAHVHAMAFEYVEGFDTSSEALPPEAQRAGVVPISTPSIAPVVAGEEFQITAQTQRRGTGVYWALGAIGVGVAVLGGVLAWRKWGKKGGRR